MNNLTWSPDGSDPQRQYLNWWYSLMPSASELGGDGYLANWWRYIADVESFKQRDGQLSDASGLVDVALDAPTAGTTLPPAIHTFAAEAMADGAVGRVDFYVDGTFVSSDSLSPYTFRRDATNQSGSHSVVAKADDAVNGWEFTSQPLTVTVASLSWTNSVKPQDVNADAFVSPIDALIIINDLNTLGSRKLASERPGALPFLDPSGDGWISAIDVLIVINFLNQTPAGEGEGVEAFEGATEAASGPVSEHVNEALSAIVAELDDNPSWTIPWSQRGRIRADR